MKAASSATKGESISAYWPNTPMKARLESNTEIASAPTPTGLMSYRCARLNSMYLGE